MWRWIAAGGGVAELAYITGSPFNGLRIFTGKGTPGGWDNLAKFQSELEDREDANINRQ